MLIQYVPEVKKRWLIRDADIDNVDPSKAAEARGVDQHLLHQGITQCELLLQEVAAVHPPPKGRDVAHP